MKTKKKEIDSLKKQFEAVANKYASLFCAKQGMDFGGWVSDNVGDIAYCSDFFFNFTDIVLDVNTEQPKGAIIDWYYENLEIPDKTIHYYSYTKGLRIKNCN